jgi:hypothetical protein
VLAAYTGTLPVLTSVVTAVVGAGELLAQALNCISSRYGVEQAPLRFPSGRSIAGSLAPTNRGGLIPPPNTKYIDPSHCWLFSSSSFCACFYWLLSVKDLGSSVRVDAFISTPPPLSYGTVRNSRGAPLYFTAHMHRRAAPCFTQTHALAQKAAHWRYRLVSAI